MMCGLLTPDSGTGTCLGYDTESAEIKRNVGYMTQRFVLGRPVDPREPRLRRTRLRHAQPRDVVDRALEDLGLQSRAEQLAGSLSGGWKQRLALAACLLHEPQLLLLDEPTAGVDPKARRDFWEQLHQLAAAASRCWSARTTWTRPSAATSSPISPTASCWRKALRPKWWPAST
jgi:ABC-2 type transport system ATP-binding protein